MNEISLITDSDLARAREDAEFRQRLLTDNLELLLGELNKLQRAANKAKRPDQVREGVELAIKLADLLRRIGPGGAARGLNPNG
jgi:hypothetical protein